MSYSNGVIVDTGDNDGVSVYDVQKALGNVAGGGTAVPENNLHDLCTHIKINKWAKYKPVRYDGIISPGEGQRRILTYPHGLDYPYYIATQHGLDAPDTIGEVAYNVMTAWNSLTPDEKSVYDGWEYKRPRGTLHSDNNDKEFYRIHDFRNQDNPTLTGYAHTVNFPCKVYLKNLSRFTISEHSDGNLYLNVNTQSDSTLVFGLETRVASAGGLSINDVITVSDLRLFVAIYDGEVTGNSHWYDEDKCLRTEMSEIITIPSDSNASFELEVNVGSLWTENTKRIHAVVGIVGKENSNDKYILLPQIEKNTSTTPSTTWDFYYPLLLSSHQDGYRTLIPVNAILKTINGNINVDDATQTTWVFHYTANTTNNNSLFEMKINMADTGNASNDILYFVGENGSVPSGATGRKLRIKAVRESGSTTVTHWLVPKNSSGKNPSTDIIIPQGDKTVFETFYAMPADNDGVAEGLFPSRSEVGTNSFNIRLYMYIGDSANYQEHALINVRYR